MRNWLWKLLGKYNGENKGPCPALWLNQHLKKNNARKMMDHHWWWQRHLKTLKFTMKTMTWETEVCRQNRSVFSSSRAWSLDAHIYITANCNFYNFSSNVCKSKMVMFWPGKAKPRGRKNRGSAKAQGQAILQGGPWSSWWWCWWWWWWWWWWWSWWWRWWRW